MLGQIGKPAAAASDALKALGANDTSELVRTAAKAASKLVKPGWW